MFHVVPFFSKMYAKVTEHIYATFQKPFGVHKTNPPEYDSSASFLSFMWGQIRIHMLYSSAESKF